MNRSVDDVRAFWEANPLWSGESRYEVGSKEFFEEHRQVYLDDCFAGSFDETLVPEPHLREQVLDLGCGPGFWVIELGERGCQMTAADLTQTALDLTSQRCKMYGISVNTHLQNAEQLTFADETFTHVNCQGVIHHTPDTAACVREIARVLRPGGTASISVYYHNLFLKSWPYLRSVGKVLSLFGGGLRGRGREHIFNESDVDEIVRLYDGSDNPIGKAYSREQFGALLSPYFEIQRMFVHFFPARSLPVRIPVFLHKILDHRCGFMLYANIRKK
jgi:2-polyprenyl-3-methyl-5-hydroxy-6-metoxy-1,4-benzoquinol methylase